MGYLRGLKLAAAMAVAATVANATSVGASVISDGLDLSTPAARLVALNAAAADGRVLTLDDACDPACQDRVAAALTARGCTRVKLLRALRMATATCNQAAMEATDAADDSGVAGLEGVLVVEDDGVILADEGVDGADEDWGVSRRMRKEDIPLTHPVTGAPYFWGLDRVNQRSQPLDWNKTAAPCYNAGADVVVFVVDSGCIPEHPQFGGRVTTLALPGSPFPPSGRDDRGHGSHVAGTVGGTDTGVAPRVRMVCVKVNNKDGHNVRRDAIAGFDYATAYKVANPLVPVIMQASFHSSRNKLDAAAARMAAQGVIPVVSAGNNGRDACRYSPGGTDHVITVANADADDSVYRSSNTGSCIDVIAPGRQILSVDYQGGLRTKTGTSMSAPHTSGVVAALLSSIPNAGSLKVADVRALLQAPTVPTVGRYKLAWLDPACPVGGAPQPGASPPTAPQPAAPPVAPQPTAPQQAVPAPQVPCTPVTSGPMPGLPQMPGAPGAVMWPGGVPVRAA